MYTAILAIFLLGYLAIALEHNIGIDKAASALITGVLCWAVYTLGAPELTQVNAIPPYIQEEVATFTDSSAEMITHYVTHFQILEHLGEIASILFFLLGAMTIVELIDAHEGFSVVTRRIHTTKRRKLLWIIAVLTFFLSAALDNLTTSIVMISLLKKLIETRRERWLFAGIVVLSANAGGAWSPIGDVTTTMLWIGTQITASGIMVKLILPSLVCMLVPVAYLSTKLHGHVKRPLSSRGLESYVNPTTPRQRKIVLISGIAGLLLVPVFKTYTHLPPFMGMMLSLGILWIITELLHRSKNLEKKSELSVVSILRRVDASSVLFFLGILLAVAALQSAGHLRAMSHLLEEGIGTGQASGIYHVRYRAHGRSFFCPGWPLLGIFGLLCRHRGQRPYHRQCFWRGRHGAGRHQLWLVPAKNNSSGFIGLFEWCCGLHIAGKRLTAVIFLQNSAGVPAFNREL
jgi:Na+/H+ antiporter NhaD/arsenite permease-like protein